MAHLHRDEPVYMILPHETTGIPHADIATTAHLSSVRPEETELPSQYQEFADVFSDQDV